MLLTLKTDIAIPNIKSKGKLKERTVQLPVPKVAESTPEAPRYNQELVTLSEERHLLLTIEVPKLVSDVFSSALEGITKIVTNTKHRRKYRQKPYYHHPHSTSSPNE